MRLRALPELILFIYDFVVIIHVYKRENAYTNDLNTWRILMIFYLFI